MNRAAQKQHTPTPEREPHGETWHRTVDPLLDKVSTMVADRGEALMAIVRFVQRHPEYDEDPDLERARIMLLPRASGLTRG